MADPISIISLAAPAIEAATICFDYAYPVKDAPKTAEELARELGALEKLLIEVKFISEQSNQPLDILNKIGSDIVQCKQLIIACQTWKTEEYDLPQADEMAVF